MDSVLVRTDRLVVRRIHRIAPTNLEMIVAIVPPGKLRPRIVGVSPDNPGGYSARMVMQDPKVEVVVGSGFWESYYPLSPVGLLLIEGKTINPINPTGLPSIVAVTKNQLLLESRRHFSAKNIQGAFQAGPELVRDGMAVGLERLRKNGNFSRAFIGVRRDGSCVLGKTIGSMNLADLATYLADSISHGGLECWLAVNLSGGGSDVLSFKSGDTVESFGNSNGSQSALLFFTR